MTATAVTARSAIDTPLPSSRFMHKTLMPEERIVHEGRFPFIYTFLCVMILLGCSAMGYIAGWILMHKLPFLGLDGRGPFVFGVVIGLWQFLWMMMKKWTTEIVLTDRRLIHKRGYFAVQVEEVDIEQLASDNVTQTFLGRIFDYGELHVRCIEATDLHLSPLAQPYAFRNAIEGQKKRYRDKYMNVEHLRRHGDSPGDTHGAS